MLVSGKRVFSSREMVIPIIPPPMIRKSACSGSLVLRTNRFLPSVEMTKNHVIPNEREESLFCGITPSPWCILFHPAFAILQNFLFPEWRLLFQIFHDETPRI